jgi:uncharacterized hydrophobic protein (TIGR00271 family)
MLHVRVVSPAGRTGQLVQTLSTMPGVQNLVVLAGGARRPEGDAVQFDVRDGAANPVFRALHDLDLASDGRVAVHRVDASLGGTAPVRRTGYLAPEVAPVWELVEANIRAGAAYPPSFYVLLTIAGLIGAVGILTNSQILIVGAMVVGPEYNAIIAVALGITQRDRRAVRAGLLALFWGFLAAVVVTFAFSAGIRAAGVPPASAFLHGIRPVANLINSPNLFSVVVAVLAGIVGVVSLTESRANALIGVFISVTTIPAAASIGVSVAYGSWSEARGSLVQLLLNVVLLIVVGAAGLRAQRAIWQRAPSSGGAT